MARRKIGGAEGRKLLKETAKKRKQAVRDERQMLVIACEDTKSSRFYFEAIFNELKMNHAIAASSLIIAKHQHTDPKGILDDLLNYPDYQDFDHRWISA